MADLTTRVPALLEEIQHALLARATAFRQERTTEADDWASFTTLMDGRPGFVIAPWCGDAACEAAIKAETQATLRNVPLGSPKVDMACVKCGRPATVRPWFAKSY